MAKYLFRSVVAFLLLTGCSKNKESNKENSIPEIVVEALKDTLTVGDEYIAKIYLSDESFLFIKNHKGEKRAVLPIFKINGNHVDSDEDFLIYKETVTLDNIDSTASGTYFKEWSCSIAFPHPKKGIVELVVGNSYVIIKE